MEQGKKSLQSLLRKLLYVKAVARRSTYSAVGSHKYPQKQVFIKPHEQIWDDSVSHKSAETFLRDTSLQGSNNFLKRKKKKRKKKNNKGSRQAEKMWKQHEKEYGKSGWQSISLCFQLRPMFPHSFSCKA